MNWIDTLKATLTVPPGYSYERRGNRYRNVTNGQWVPFRNIYNVLNANQDHSAEVLSNLCVALRSKDIDLQTWFVAMEAQLRILHVQNAALGAGGFSSLQPIDFMRIDSVLRDEVNRLERFGNAIVDTGITQGQIDVRCAMYAGTARKEFYKARKLPALDYGQVAIERRVLGVAEHCSWCTYLNDLGWQMAGILPVPGESGVTWDGDQCLSNCKCDLERKIVTFAQAEEMIQSPVQSVKAWDESAHPRYPDGTQVDETGAGGGRFAPKEESATQKQPETKPKAKKPKQNKNTIKERKTSLTALPKEDFWQRDDLSVDDVVFYLSDEVRSFSDSAAESASRLPDDLSRLVEIVTENDLSFYDFLNALNNYPSGASFSKPDALSVFDAFHQGDAEGLRLSFLERLNAGEFQFAFPLDEPTEIEPQGVFSATSHNGKLEREPDTQSVLLGEFDVHHRNNYEGMGALFSDADSRLAETSGFTSGDFEKLRDQWFETSNGYDLRSLSVQDAASVEFNASLSAWQKNRISDAKRAAARAGGDERELLFEADKLRKMLRSVYDDTQEWLKSKGVTHVRLYRGTSLGDRANVHAGDVVSYDDNALSSWSLRREVAEKFTDGVIVSSVFPVDRVFGTPFSGIGSLTGDEFVVVGSNESSFAKVEAVGTRNSTKALNLQVKAWDESAHPRHPEGTADGGKFAPKDGGESPSPSALKAAEIRGKFADIKAKYAKKIAEVEPEIAVWRDKGNAAMRNYLETKDPTEMADAKNSFREMMGLQEVQRRFEREMNLECRGLMAVSSPISTQVGFARAEDNATKMAATNAHDFIRSITSLSTSVKNIAVRSTAVYRKMYGDIESTGRSFFSQKHGAICLDFADSAVAAHEMGHWLEYWSPGLRDRSLAFLDRRTQGEDVVPMRDATGNQYYGESEVTRKDKFINPYIGKHYENENGERRATEIISMGLEYLYNDPIKFAEQDPDMFDFVVNTLSGQ